MLKISKPSFLTWDRARCDVDGVFETQAVVVSGNNQIYSAANLLKPFGDTDNRMMIWLYVLNIENQIQAEMILLLRVSISP